VWRSTLLSRLSTALRPLEENHLPLHILARYDRCLKQKVLERRRQRRENVLLHIIQQITVGTRKVFRNSRIIWSLAQGERGQVQVWDARTGRKLLTYRGHSDYVHALSWSPEGRCIASVGYDGSVQVWDATTGDYIGK
jgi:hypothetical protein